LFDYDATGTQLRKEIKLSSAQIPDYYDYCGSFVYKNNVLQFILTLEGRLTPNGTQFTYEYYLKDHLGNTRALFSVDANCVPKLLETDNYYAFWYANRNSFGK